jgi:hypothetical protein
MAFAPSTLIIGSALLLLFGALIVIPLLDRKQPYVEAPSPVDALEHERIDTVRAIRELDFDHRTGKIEDSDYFRLRGEYVQRGAQLLKQIETLQSSASATDAAIERAIKPLRAKSTKTCANCGVVLRGDDKFCPQCGVATATAATS